MTKMLAKVDVEEGLGRTAGMIANLVVEVVHQGVVGEEEEDRGDHFNPVAEIDQTDLVEGTEMHHVPQRSTDQL